MNELLTDYGILFLVLIFIIISLYYKNFINIGIFILSFLGLKFFVSNEIALIISYCLAIIYGIVKNFHLLENFVSSNKNVDDNEEENKLNEHLDLKSLLKKNNIKYKELNTIDSNDESTKTINKNSDKENLGNSKNNFKKSLKKNKKGSNKVGIKKLNNQEKDNLSNNLNSSDDIPEVHEIITEDLINKFIRRLKNEDEFLIIKKKINLYKINPTVNKLSKNKVDKLKSKMLSDDSFVKKPIVITNDYFILDGHHRWYARKSLIENNTNGYNDSGVYSEDITVVIIDYSIKKCIQKLQEYKIKYNKEYLKKTIDEINDISDGKKYLHEIKDVIKNLENNYNKFASVELV